VTAKLDRDLAARMACLPAVYEAWNIARQLEAALAEIDRLSPVVDAAERWTDSGAVHDETVMDAVRAMRHARGR
jgi:hypothetical protein